MTDVSEELGAEGQAHQSITQCHVRDTPVKT